MNWDRTEGNWRQAQRQGPIGRGANQIGVTDGHRGQLHWKIQEIHGVSKEEAERELRYWESSLD